MTPARQLRTPAHERGTVLVVVLGMVVMLGIACSAFLMMSISSNREQSTTIHRRKALYVAEGGITEALVQLAPTLIVGTPAMLGTEAEPQAVLGGRYWVTGRRSVDGTIELVGTGQYRNERVTIAANFEQNASLRDFAVYAGNSSGDPDYEFNLGGVGPTADAVTGDVYVSGDITLTGDSTLDGDAYVTGIVTGNPITGSEHESTPPVAPPDLSAMNYAATSDFYIDVSTPFDGSGNLPEGDPRHIFVKDFRSDLATDAGFVFNNDNYFLGDPHEGANLTRVSVPPAGNNKVYYVDGNVWIEPQGITSQLVNSPPEGTVITIVVRGNIYFSDYLQYDDPAHDGILFIALSDGESYTDLDGDNQYDIGEPLLHDDGDGIYEGNAEGSGNIHFGDPNGGPLGDVHGFLYAENHFEDHVLDGVDGEPLPFSVTGFLSAGEQLRINREFGGGHAEMTIDYDSRVQDGTLDFPGFPGGGGPGNSWQLSCWRVAESQ